MTKEEATSKAKDRRDMQRGESTSEDENTKNEPKEEKENETRDEREQVRSKKEPITSKGNANG